MESGILGLGGDGGVSLSSSCLSFFDSWTSSRSVDDDDEAEEGGASE